MSVVKGTVVGLAALTAVGLIVATPAAAGVPRAAPPASVPAAVVGAHLSSAASMSTQSRASDYTGVGGTLIKPADVPKGTDEAAVVAGEGAVAFAEDVSGGIACAGTQTCELDHPSAAARDASDADVSAALAAQGQPQLSAAEAAATSLATEQSVDPELSQRPRWWSGAARIPKGCAKKSTRRVWIVGRFRTCFYRQFPITDPATSRKAHIEEFIEQLTDSHSADVVTRVSVRAKTADFPWSSVRMAANWENVEKRSGGRTAHFCAPVSPCKDSFRKPSTLLRIPARGGPPGPWKRISYRRTSYVPPRNRITRSVDLTKLHFWIPDVIVTDGYAPDLGTFFPYDHVWRRVDRVTKIGGVGGVIDRFAPVFIGLDKGDPYVSSSARLVDHAQRTIYGVNPNGKRAYHPGRPGTGNTPLYRTWGADPRPPHRDVIRRNRYWACKGFRTRTPGLPPRSPSYDTCDEYPFASTWNGAYRFRRADGLSVRGHVPRFANVNAGRRLGIFLRANRIIKGDAYWVRVEDSRL